MKAAHAGLAGLLLLAGCNEPPPPPPPPPFSTAMPMKQLMEWVIDPAADVVWDSVKTIMTMEGTTEIAPKTEEQWAAVRNSAATLVEAGNLLMLDGRARGGQEWMAHARRLSDSAQVALKAAEAKNAGALFDAGGGIYNSCKACHDRYAAFDRPAAQSQPVQPVQPVGPAR